MIIENRLRHGNKKISNKDQAIGYIKSKIDRDQINDYWSNSGCVFYVADDQNDKYIVEIHEKSERTDNCMGTAGTTPLLASFSINKADKDISYYDIAKDQMIPYDTFLERKNRVGK